MSGASMAGLISLAYIGGVFAWLMPFIGVNKSARTQWAAFGAFVLSPATMPFVVLGIAIWTLAMFAGRIPMALQWFCAKTVEAATAEVKTQMGEPEPPKEKTP